MSEIYYHTNQNRILSRKNDSFIEYASKNWLGLLPLAAKLLPPSFNQDELYNPLRLAKVPTHHPLSLQSFYDMPINSVRSYAFQGDLVFPIENTLIAKHGFVKWLEKSHINLNIPLSLILRGEYRISILKKSKTKAWVGLQRTQTSGYNIGLSIGNQFHLLENALPWLPWEWGGLPIPIHPFLINHGGYTIQQFNLLYEFDLNQKIAQEAFEKSIKGNFSLAEKEAKKNTSSVQHMYTKSQIKQKTEHQGSHNFFVANQIKQNISQIALIALNTKKTKHDFLQVNHSRSVQNQNIFSGSSQTLHHTTADIPIKKLENKSHFTLDADETLEVAEQIAPFTVKSTLQVQIPLADYEQTEKAIQKSFYFLSTPRTHIFQLPPKQHFEYTPPLNPHLQVSTPHQQTQVLGGLYIKCVAYFTEEDFTRASNIPADQARKILYETLGLPQNPTFLQRASAKIIALTTLPLRLSNSQIGISSLDFVEEVLENLQKLKESNNPKDKQKILDNLIDRSLPTNLTRSLIALSGSNRIVRKAHFFTQPTDFSPAVYRHTYNNMNNQNIALGPKDKELKAFRKNRSTNILPSTEAQIQSAPQLQKFTLDLDQESIVGTLLYKAPPHTEIFIYGKLSQSGRISIGRLQIAEGITTVKTTKHQGLNKITFPITGDDSFLYSFIMANNLGLSGSDYTLEVAVSTDSNAWSSIQRFSFQYQDGFITKSSL